MSSILCDTLIWVLMSDFLFSCSCESLSSPRTVLCPQKTTYWLTSSVLAAKRQWPPPLKKKVWALYTINPPPAWPVHHYEMSFSSGFLCPPPPSLKWPIPTAPIFVCRPAQLVYFTAIPSTSPSRSVVSHCFSASVGNRRNHRCRLLGPQQRWGAV